MGTCGNRLTTKKAGLEQNFNGCLATLNFCYAHCGLTGLTTARTPSPSLITATKTINNRGYKDREGLNRHRNRDYRNYWKASVWVLMTRHIQPYDSFRADGAQNITWSGLLLLRLDNSSLAFYMGWIQGVCTNTNHAYSMLHCILWILDVFLINLLSYKQCKEQIR